MPECGSDSDIICDLIRPYGYLGCLFSELPVPGQLLEEVALGIRWPKEYLRTYCQGRYEQDDPLFHRCRHSLLPFVWTENCTENETSARGRDILDVAAQYGFRSGFIVPVHGPKGYAACIRLGGSAPDTSLETRTFLRNLALNAFEKLLLIRESSMLLKPLTQREQEVLELVARGKSGKEIGLILSITKRTADEHVYNACQKLGAANRTHAIAIAIGEEIISI